MSAPRHLLGAVLLSLSVIFAAWDAGNHDGRLIVSVALFVWGMIEFEVFSDDPADLADPADEFC